MGNGSVKPAYNVGKYPVTQSGVKRFSPFQPNLNEFPTPSFLRDENVRFAEWHAAYPYATHAYDLECLPDDIKKSDLFQKENYAHIDAHALQAPPGLVQATPHGAVKYLIKICSTDLEKVRVLFVWTCSLDPYGTEGMAVNGSVKEILLSIKKCLKRLNDLFHQLCVWAGLHVQEVKGIGKSNVFTGDNIVWSSDGEVGVTTVWVAVEIQGCWRFIDIHMASYNLWCRQNGLQQYHADWEFLDDNDQGYKRIDDKPVELHHEINEFFFLTDPHEFIYTHYPDEPKWQLLARQVTYLEFMNLAPLESYFFDLGLEMMNAKSLNLVVQGKETVLKFGIPDPKKNAMYYMWRKTPLWYYLEPTRQYIKFEKHEKELWCKVSVPTSGKYKVRLYLENSSNEYLPCATYTLHCTVN